MKSFVGKDMADYFDVLETLKLQNSLTKYDVKKFIEQYKNIKYDEITNNYLEKFIKDNELKVLSDDRRRRD